MEIKDGVGTMIDELSLDVSDEELLKLTDEWIAKGERNRVERKTKYDENKEYYLGTQLKGKQVTDNRTFLSAETIIPIASASIPHPNVLPAKDTIESIKLAKDWEQILSYMYKAADVQKKVERAVRFVIMNNYAIFKYYFCPEDMCNKVRVVHPNRVLFDNNRDIDDGLNWVGELITCCADELVEKFPDKKKEITQAVQGKMGTEITYTEIWTDEMVIHRFKNILLSKAKNPNYNYSSDQNEKESEKKGKDKDKAKPTTKNFFDRPRHPYIPVNLFDFGETITGETSLVDQIKTLQDGVNKRKAQIDKNAQIVNGKVIGTGINGLKKEEFASIDWTDSTKGIFMTHGEVGDIVRVSGSPLPAFVESDMMHSINEIDNLMGTHSTTRGEREGRETATGRSILRESDRGRIDIIGRRFEEALQKVFEGWTQLTKVYYTSKQTVAILGGDNSKEFLKIDRNNIEDGIEIEIIPGTLIPQDAATRMNRALSLANSQQIDPITLYEEMGIKNPLEKAKRLFQWTNDPMALFAELQQQEQTQGEANTEASILKAEDESKRMIAGEPQPPFEKADANHINVHADLLQQNQNEMSPEVIQLFIDHIKGEQAIVEGNVKKNM